MDKASIIKDAIEYIQRLQAEEQQMLREVAALESTAAASAAPAAANPFAGLGADEEHEYGHHHPSSSSERTKKVKRALSVSSISDALLAAAAPAPPVEIQELRVSEVGDRVLVVSVTCSKRRDAMAGVPRPRGAPPPRHHRQHHLRRRLPHAHPLRRGIIQSPSPLLTSRTVTELLFLSLGLTFQV